jgi:hypothetical protein
MKQDGNVMKIKQYSKKIIKGQAGQILLIALIMLAIGAIIIGVIATEVSSGLKQGTVIEKRNSQLYLADGGVDQAIFWINNSSSVTVASLPTVVNNYSSLPIFGH